MPKYQYKAKQGPKKVIDGIIEADSVDGAVTKIIALGYHPIDVKSSEQHTAKTKGSVQRSLLSSLDFSQRVPIAEVALFTRQIADLIDAGVPMLRTLGIVEQQMRHATFKNVVNQIYVMVKDGETLSGAMQKFPNIFSPLYVNMIKSGELGSHLNIVMNRLADFIEQDQEVRRHVMTSLLYPMLILVVGVIAVTVLLIWFVPNLTQIFEDMDVTLPLPTLMLLGVSDFLARFWWILLLALLFSVMYFQRLQSSITGRFKIDEFKLRIPLLGNFVKNSEIARFARTLGTLLDSGVVITPALQSVALVIDNSVIKQEVESIAQDVTNGSSLTQALKGYEHFPDAVVSMVSVGEETGEIHKGLYKLAALYERQTENTLKGLMSLLGPLLILGIGGIILFVVIAMLVPILNMNLVIK